MDNVRNDDRRKKSNDSEVNINIKQLQKQSRNSFMPNRQSYQFTSQNSKSPTKELDKLTNMEESSILKSEKDDILDYLMVNAAKKMRTGNEYQKQRVILF